MLKIAQTTQINYDKSLSIFKANLYTCIQDVNNVVSKDSPRCLMCIISQLLYSRLICLLANL